MKDTLYTKDYETFTVGGITLKGSTTVKHALPGDIVEVDNGMVKKIIIRSTHTGLIGTLEVSSKSKYGYTSRSVPIYLFIPWNESYPPFYVGSSYKVINPGKNVIAKVDFESWNDLSNCPRGICREIIGVCGDVKAEEEALILHTHPVKWKGAYDLVPRVPLSQGGSHLSANTFHVDPAGCKDIDDAISIWMNGPVLECRIHIADVASLLSNNTALWTAERLGETLYVDGQIVSPMFPTDVQDACSLTPGMERSTLTLALSFNVPTKSIVKKWWIQQDIIVKKSYTYYTIMNTIDGDLLQMITSGITSRTVTDPHEWIAELMLFYNKEAAKILQQFGSGILRRHSEPDYELLSNLEKQSIAPVFLAFKAGEYCDATASDTSHWGIKENAYCHATSPIRRWVDCINQSILIKSLFIPEFVVPKYDIVAVNLKSNQTKMFERDLFFMKMLLENPSQKVKGSVITAGPQKAKVWVPEWNRCVSLYEFMDVGDKIQLSVYMNPSRRNWKRRLVLEVLDEIKIEDDC